MNIDQLKQFIHEQSVEYNETVKTDVNTLAGIERQISNIDKKHQLAIVYYLDRSGSEIIELKAFRFNVETGEEVSRKEFLEYTNNKKYENAMDALGE